MPNQFKKRVPTLVPNEHEPLMPHLTNNAKDINFTQKKIRERRIKILKRLKPVSCIHSFLFRTLNDYIHRKPEQLTGLQRATISYWRGAGMGKNQAAKQISKLYGLGGTANEVIDLEYLKVTQSELDNKFFKDIKNADFTSFHNNMSISPVRITEAFSAGTSTALTDAEKDFLSIPETEHEFLEYRLKNLSKPSITAFIKRDKLIEMTTSLAIPMYEQINTSVSHYRMQARLNKYTLIKSSDHIGGKADPRFLIYAFRNPDPINPDPASPPKCIKLTFNSLGDDRNECTWTKYDDWCDSVYEFAAAIDEYPFFQPFQIDTASMCDRVVFPTSPHMAVGSTPMFIVKAFEDDTWFSEETRQKAAFALDLAQFVSQFDPSGLASLAVAIVNTAWSLFCALDDIDDDDQLGFGRWEIDESAIPLDQDYTVRNNIFDFKEPGGDNHWKLEISALFFDPINIEI